MSARSPKTRTPVGVSARPRASYARLPAGVHGIAPELVRANQTSRLQAAMVELVAERGYGAVSVADVLTHAAVSRRTFYEHYPNKQACFSAAYQAIVGDWVIQAAAAQASVVSWREQLRCSLLSVVERVVADPAAAHVVFIDALAACADVPRRQAQLVAEFEQLARRAFELAPGGPRIPPSMFTVLVGGASGIVAKRLRDGRTSELPTLTDPIVEWMICYRSKAATEVVHAASLVATDGRARAAAEAARDELLTRPGSSLWLDDSALPVVWLAPRERILAAITQIVAGKGYGALSVAEVARVAQTTHQTFNKLFVSKQAAFVAAAEEGLRRAATAAAEASARAPDWPAAVRDALVAELGFLASHPEIARIGLLELYAAGDEAARLREVPLRTLGGLLERGNAQSRAATRPPTIAGEAITSGILVLMRDTVLRRGPERLPAILPDATYAALAPFIGPRRAAAEATRGVGG